MKHKPPMPGEWERRDFGRERKVLSDSSLRLLILGIVLIVGGGIFFYHLSGERSALQSPNSLGTTVAGEVQVGFNDSREEGPWNWDRLLARRRDAVRAHQDLVAGEYVPSELVFGLINPAEPWLPVQNLIFFGSSADNFNGPPYEYRHIANPFILIFPEFATFSLVGNPPLKWKKSVVSHSLLKSREFPLYPVPVNTTWSPREHSAKVLYDISSFRRSLSPYVDEVPPAAPLEFGVLAINASDFGFRYMQLAPEESMNIVNPENTTSPVPIVQGIGYFDEPCYGAPGKRCNQEFATPKAYTSLRVQALPAHAVFRLWRDKPSSEETSPDFRFGIQLR